MSNLVHFQQIVGAGPYAQVIRGFSGVSPFGTVWFVNSSTGNNGNEGKSAGSPLATLAYALSTKAAAGDTIVLAPGFSETLTTALAISLTGLTIIGIGRGTQKPKIVVNGAVDGLNITGANVLIENIHFPAPETDNATAMINVAAAGVTLRNISGIGSQTSKNFVSGITIASGADDLTIEGLRINNSVVAMDNFISIEAAVARLRLREVYCFGDCVTGGIIDGAQATQIDWQNVRIYTVGTTIPAITLDSNPTGSIDYGRFCGTHTTLATNANYGNLLRLSDCLVLEETDASKQAALIPAVDAD